MASVSRNIEGANRAQTNASAMFTTTNDELNGAISQMEKNMRTLGEQITQGLTDISESNRNMRATGKKLEQLKELPDSFDKLHGHFQELLAQGTQTLLVLDKLAGELRSDPHQRGQLLSEAVKEGQAPHAVLDALLEAEHQARESRRVRTALRLSSLPTGHTLADFDFAFQPAIERSGQPTDRYRRFTPP